MIRFFRTPYLVKLLFFNRIWGFSCHENKVYLTFDDGPHPDITPWILEFLKSEDIKATFFCVGDNVNKYPEIYHQILNDGHQVGNHTMYHTNASKTDKLTYFNSFKEATKNIKSELFRPPYGRLPMSWEKEIKKEFKIIMWSWLSYDFDTNVPINYILKKAKKIKKGDILVLHDNPKITQKQKELLPKLIDYLKKQKFNFETIITNE